MTDNPNSQSPLPSSLLEKVIRFCLQNRMIVFFAAIILVGWGLVVAPFD